MKPLTTGRGERSRVGRWLPMAISLILGLSLFWLAIPRTVAAWISIEGEAVFGKIWNVPPPSDTELKTAAAALRRAIEWAPTGKRLTHLALIEVTQAQRLAITAPERAPLLERAERHLTQGLSIDPVDGFSWLALGLARQLNGSSPRQVARAAMQSLDMAPNMRWLWLSRAEIFFRYASSLQGDELLAVRSQLRTIWSTDPSFRVPLLVAASRADNTSMLFDALNGDLEAQAELEKLRREQGAAQRK